MILLLIAAIGAALGGLWGCWESRWMMRVPDEED